MKISAKSFQIGQTGPNSHTAQELAQKILDNKAKGFRDHVFLLNHGVFSRHQRGGWHHRNLGYFTLNSEIGMQCESIFESRHELMTMCCQMLLDIKIPYNSILNAPWNDIVLKFGYTGYMSQRHPLSPTTLHVLFQQDIDEILAQ
jgi:hypothetical protein